MLKALIAILNTPFGAGICLAYQNSRLWVRWQTDEASGYLAATTYLKSSSYTTCFLKSRYYLAQPWGYNYEMSPLEGIHCLCNSLRDV